MKWSFDRRAETCAFAWPEFPAVAGVRFKLRSVGTVLRPGRARGPRPGRFRSSRPYRKRALPACSVPMRKEETFQDGLRESFAIIFSLPTSARSSSDTGLGMNAISRIRL